MVDEIVTNFKIANSVWKATNATKICMEIKIATLSLSSFWLVLLLFFPSQPEKEIDTNEHQFIF